MCHIPGMRRDDICLYVSPANRVWLEAIVTDRNSTCKAVWRARIVLATADDHGTNEIMRLTGKSKPCVWRWQERYIEEGVARLLRDKTRPPVRGQNQPDVTVRPRPPYNLIRTYRLLHR